MKATSQLPFAYPDVLATSEYYILSGTVCQLVTVRLMQLLFPVKVFVQHSLLYKILLFQIMKNRRWLFIWIYGCCLIHIAQSNGTDITNSPHHDDGKMFYLHIFYFIPIETLFMPPTASIADVALNEYIVDNKRKILERPRKANSTKILCPSAGVNSQYCTVWVSMSSLQCGTWFSHILFTNLFMFSNNT